MDIAERLRQLRDRNSWTAQAMAEKTGLPKRTLESYMLRERAPLPGLEALKRLSLGLGVSLDWLVFGAEPVAADVERLVRLSARASAVIVFEAIIRQFAASGDPETPSDNLLGLSAEEWAAEVGWGAGERARELAGMGVTRGTLQVAENVVQQSLQHRVERRLKSAGKASHQHIEDPT